MTERLGARAALDQLDGWAATDDDRDAITKSFRFKGFTEAFAFMAGVATRAEAADHHPEWFNVYNRVDVVLTTNDADGVTEKDIALAQVMDALAGGLS